MKDGLKIRIDDADWQVHGAVEEAFDLPRGSLLSVDLASGGHWFGHGFSHVQPLPLETGEVVNERFAVNNIQSPIWMASAGHLVWADTTAPLEVRINEQGSGLLTIRCAEMSVTIRLFSDDNLPRVRARLMARLGWPNLPPEVSFFGDALFCTWTQYPRCITQARILEMARQIRAHNYPCSTLIIDDRWESCFGELAFAADFPDPRAMVAALHALGFHVWLWVTPFVNREAAVFDTLARSGALVRARDGGGAALFRWWGGTAGLVDVTGPAGQAWLRERLTFLKEAVGVDGFKIDGGDFKYQPDPANAVWHDDRGASGYSDALLELFEQVAPNRCETRTAWLSQQRRIIWREGGKDSHWGADNGLRAMVSLALHLGLLGYDILIPDMVPGRVQTMQTGMALPTDELMVRWTEASALMPLVQFSYFPWNYAPGVERIIRGYAHLHKALEGYIAVEASQRSAPLLRPIWYDAPEARDLYGVADQFMLGSDLLAAPVLKAGQIERDVALPPGEWIDLWSGKRHAGGRLVTHPAPCPGMPLFLRAHRSDLLQTLRPLLEVIDRGSVRSGVTSATYEAGLDRDLNVTG